MVFTVILRLSLVFHFQFYPRMLFVCSVVPFVSYKYCSVSMFLFCFRFRHCHHGEGWLSMYVRVQVWVHHTSSRDTFVPDKYGIGSRNARRVGVRRHIFYTRLLVFVVALRTLSLFSLFVLPCIITKWCICSCMAKVKKKWDDDVFLNTGRKNRLHRLRSSLSSPSCPSWIASSSSVSNPKPCVSAPFLR